MSEHFGEEITLRELKVRFMLFSEFAENPDAEIPLSRIASHTGVPSATLARYLTFCIVDGCMKERVDPKDRRRRLLKLAQTGADRMAAFLADARVNGFPSD